MVIMLGSAFDRFCLFFRLAILPIVYCIWTAASVVIFFRFLFYFCSFNFSLGVSFHSIQPLCAPLYVRPHIHIWRMNTISSVDGIGHKTGTHRNQVKCTLLPPQNSSGELAPWSYADLIPAGLEPSELNLDTSKYMISCRQVYLWITVRQKGLINRHDVRCNQSIAWWLVGCVFYLVLECTRFWEKPDHVYPFLKIVPGI